MSNRQSSTFVALAENRAKFTPRPSHVAPKGKGRPSWTRCLAEVEVRTTFLITGISFIVRRRLSFETRQIDLSFNFSEGCISRPMLRVRRPMKNRVRQPGGRHMQTRRLNPLCAFLERHAPNTA